MKTIAGVTLFVILLSSILLAQELKPIQLSPPDTTGGKPLMQVLKERQSIRDFSADTLTIPILSNLLWAACGINRADEAKRTAPSAMNKQEIDLYITTANGAYLYNPIQTCH